MQKVESLQKEYNEKKHQINKLTSLINEEEAARDA
jgi:uncharacterized protein YlxW (UPF0749 family)